MKIRLAVLICLASSLPAFADDLTWPISDPLRSRPWGFQRLIPNNKAGHLLLFKERLRENFDGACLSTPSTSCSYRVQLSRKGMPSYQRLTSKFMNDADKFYCEQAVWESFPHRTKFTLQDTVVFDTTLRSLFHELVQDDRSIVKMHFVPGSILTGTDVPLSRQDIHSPANVVSFSIKTVNRKQLTSFREDWIFFIKANKKLTRDELVDFVKLMRQKYHRLFQTKDLARRANQVS